MLRMVPMAMVRFGCGTVTRPGLPGRRYLAVATSCPDQLPAVGPEAVDDFAAGVGFWHCCRPLSIPIMCVLAGADFKAKNTYFICIFKGEKAAVSWAGVNGIEGDMPTTDADHALAEVFRS